MTPGKLEGRVIRSSGRRQDTTVASSVSSPSAFSSASSSLSSSSSTPSAAPGSTEAARAVEELLTTYEAEEVVAVVVLGSPAAFEEDEKSSFGRRSSSSCSSLSSSSSSRSCDRLLPLVLVLPRRFLAPPLDVTIRKLLFCLQFSRTPVHGGDSLAENASHVVYVPDELSANAATTVRIVAEDGVPNAPGVYLLRRRDMLRSLETRCTMRHVPVSFSLFFSHELSPAAERVATQWKTKSLAVEDTNKVLATCTGSER
mmetsp:Transcript_1937/g.3836  ORF Transcript_1937/g.3836 Transcript_1937/m.3836 type:complete len:257 (-) Transcript_1937:213-983(-)